MAIVAHALVQQEPDEQRRQHRRPGDRQQHPLVLPRGRRRVVHITKATKCHPKETDR
jgi:hypothetical protein